MADYSVTIYQFRTLLPTLQVNTPDTPYEIEITEITKYHLNGHSDEEEWSTLQWYLQQNPSKFVSIIWGQNTHSVLSSITNGSFLFYRCPSLVNIDLSYFTSITDAKYMFCGCTNLRNLDVSSMTNIASQAHYMFAACSSLESINGLVLTSVTSASRMFSGCSALTNINTSSFTSITNANSMFSECTSLTRIDISKMKSITNADYMFSQCSSLEEIHGWIIPKTATMRGCFQLCASLRAIYVPESRSIESTWHAWEMSKDTANSQTAVKVYNLDGTSVSVNVPSTGTYSTKVTDKVDELLFASSAGTITSAMIQKMLQIKAPITGRESALDPTNDNFVLWAKNQQAIKTNIVTNVVEANNPLPPSSAAVHAAIGALIPIPTGTVLPYGGTEAPTGFHLCDNQEALRADYPNLINWAITNNAIGADKLLGPGNGSTTFRFPDMQECVIVGAGRNTRYGISNHDIYAIGQFRDDQLQNHVHNYNIHNTQAGNDRENKPYEVDGETTRNTGGATGARVGDCTHGKQIGMNFIIKL